MFLLKLRPAGDKTAEIWGLQGLRHE